MSFPVIIQNRYPSCKQLVYLFIYFTQWEHINAKFDIDYTDLTKSESTNILAIHVREHLNNKKYQNHIKIFTDGSVLDSLDSGAGFIIPELKVQKSFYLGKGFSIFTSELYAILNSFSLGSLVVSH